MVVGRLKSPRVLHPVFFRSGSLGVLLLRLDRIQGCLNRTMNRTSTQH